MKRILLLSILLALTACAPATIAAPSPTPSSIPTSTQTATPAPTATMTATQIPPIEIIHQSLETCPGFEILCTNPHAFGLEGQALADWRKLREQKDNEYETAWRDLLSQTAAEGKWQAEFYTFFSEEAPDISQWDTLDWRQRMNAVAAWLRVYGDGLTAVNIPTSWMNEFASGRQIVFEKHNVDGPFSQIGYKFTFPSSSGHDYDVSPSVLSFGRTVTNIWTSRNGDFGFFAKDYISPVNIPGKNINEMAGVLVYARDKQGIPHATIQIIPFLQQSIGRDYYYVRAGDGGKLTLTQGPTDSTTAEVTLVRNPLGATGERFSINKQNAKKLSQKVL
jgi:hypothetical protein